MMIFVRIIVHPIWNVRTDSCTNSEKDNLSFISFVKKRVKIKQHCSQVTHECKNTIHRGQTSAQFKAQLANVC